jgi:aspartate carbamoyltransferase
MTTPIKTNVRHSAQFKHQFHPAPINGDFHGKHIVTVEQFASADLRTLFKVAANLKARVRRNDRSLQEIAYGKLMATLFFEASTRTDMSFQAAMHRLGGAVIATAGGVQFSSVYKGENLADTVRAAGCYADVIVLRHPDVGSSYEAAFYLDQLSSRLNRRPVVVSGGDGIGEHPTQALLDIYTIVEAKQTLDNLHITMVGDLRHGRTVHSLAKLIARSGAKGVRISCVSPALLQLPRDLIATLQAQRVTVYETDDLADALGETDVIYWTRIQEERFASRADYEAIADSFVMTPAVLSRASADAVLMHPLPRKHEMGTPDDHDVLDADPRSIYFQQMENGMYVRMALLAMVMGVWQG